MYLWTDPFADFKTFFRRGLGKLRMNINEREQKTNSNGVTKWKLRRNCCCFLFPQDISPWFSSALVLYNIGSLLWLETTSGLTLCSNNKTNIKVPQEGSLNCCTNQGINSCVFSHAIKRCIVISVWVFVAVQGSAKLLVNCIIAWSPRYGCKTHSLHNTGGSPGGI